MRDFKLELTESDKASVIKYLANIMVERGIITESEYNKIICR